MRIGGFHTAGSGGNPTGIGDFVRSLSAAGIPAAIVCADGIVGIGDALATDTDHHLAYRVVRDGAETYALPRYDLSPHDAAVAYRQLLEPFIPQEVRDHKDKIWIILGNEVDKNRSRWLAQWAVESAAVWAEYKVLFFGWSAGEPEPEHWRTPEMLDFLRLCERERGRVGVALHEYSYVTETLVQDGFRIGRYRDLYAACAENGINRPFVLITEFGWTHERVPEPITAISHIDAVFQTYQDYPPFAIWYLGPGFDNIANRVQPMIEPLTQYLLDSNEEPPPMAGEPRVDYERTYILLPPTATDPAWARAIVDATVSKRYTVGYSADDAGIGDLTYRRVIAVNAAEWGDSLENFYQTYYPGVIYVPVNAATPEALRLALEYFVQHGVMPPISSDVFSSPVEPQAGQIWPPNWVDATPYLTYYTFGSNNTPAYHTGADLNKNYPSWNLDRGMPVYAVADGTVTYSRLVTGSTWGNLIVIRHRLRDGTTVHSRYGHLATRLVSANQIVSRGQQIGTIGGSAYVGNDHLHFDISHSGILETNATHWPGTNRQGVIDNYLDPKAYLEGKADAPVEPEQFGPAGTIHIVEGLPNNPSSIYSVYKDEELQPVLRQDQHSPYAEYDLSVKDTIVIHHSVGLPTTPPESIAIGHLNRNGGGVEGYPAIGYHYYILGDGRIFRTNYLNARSFHAGTWNLRSVGICLAGDFTTAHPTTAQILSCRALVDWLRTKLGTPRVLKHKDVAATQCPGNSWSAWWAAATGEVISQPDPTYPDVGTFIRGLDQPASDWYWPTARQAFDRTGLYPKFHSHGTNIDWYASYKHPEFNLVRIVIDRGYTNRNVDNIWHEMSLQIAPWYARGQRDFIFLNEPNTRHEHVGKLWDNAMQFISTFQGLIDRARRDYPIIRIWYPGMSPGGDGSGTQWDWNGPAAAVIGNCDGIIQHVYTGITDNVSAAALQMADEVSAFQRAYAANKVLVIGEFAVNRPASATYKAQVYKSFFDQLATRRGIKAAYSFSASWHPAEDPNMESWYENAIDVAYANL